MNYGDTAIELWEKMTGTKVDSRSFSGTIGQTFSIYSANKRIQQARELGDDTSLTLVIRHLLDEYALNVSFSFSLAEILDGVADEFETIFEPAQELKTFLDTDGIRAPQQAFFDECCLALSFYREQAMVDFSGRTREMIERQSGMIALDAINDLDKLTKLTMFDGQPDEDANPKVNHLIFAFDNLEELIDHGAQIPNGFSLCAIVSPHISDSYFVLVIRNGGHVTIVTDKGNYTHPLQQERMRSRNDRYNLDRIENSRFPYDLLNIEWSDNGRRAEAGKTGQGIMESDTGFRVLATLKDLDDWDLLWFHFFIQQCQQRYFVDRVREPVMATGSMIRLTHRWAGEDRFPVPSTQVIEFDARSSKELSTEFMHTLEPDWENRANPNVWMEKRFADQVPEDALYIPPSAFKHGDELVKLTVDKNGTRVSKEDATGLAWYDREKLNPINIRPLDLHSLDTRERVIRDAHFMARHNQTMVIKELVNVDYEARQKEVMQWFNKAVVKNLPNFIDDLLSLNHEAFYIDSAEFDKHVSDLSQRGGGVFSQINTRSGGRRRDIMVSYEPVAKQRIISRESEERFPDTRNELDLVDYIEGCYRCYLDSDDPAQLFLRLHVATVADIMKLTGLSMDEIPPELHSRGLRVYTGNSILDRIDPLATLDNPWDKLPLRFCLPVSLKSFKAWRKAQGLQTHKASDIAKKTADEARELWQATVKEQKESGNEQ